jgi:hypothetical protein
MRFRKENRIGGRCQHREIGNPSSPDFLRAETGSLPVPGVGAAVVEKCELSELSPVCGRHPQENGTIFLPTSCVFGNVPSSGVRVIRPGMTSAGVRRRGVFQVVKELNRARLGAPATRLFLLSTMNAAERRDPSLSH